MSAYKLPFTTWYVIIQTDVSAQKQINHQKTGCFTDILLKRLKCQCVKYITILRLMGADPSWCMLHKATISSLCTQLPMFIQGEVDKSLYMVNVLKFQTLSSTLWLSGMGLTIYL